MPKKKTEKKPPKVPVHYPPMAHQVRIIGGAWKRTPLPVLESAGLRPTPDRVRETVFNWINHVIGGDWDRLDCLDLFAGSGALGFEAASRGARSVTMVDFHAPIVRQLEAIKLKLHAEQVTLMRGDAATTAPLLAAQGRRFGLVFLDPPYQEDWLERMLPSIAPLVEDGGLAYVEWRLPLQAQEGAAAPAWLAGWQVLRSDKAGMVHFHLLQKKSQ